MRINDDADTIEIWHGGADVKRNPKFSSTPDMLKNDSETYLV